MRKSASNKRVSHEVALPFFSRAYGGFTREQQEYLRTQIGRPAGKRIFDPMAGQAFSLSRLALEGAHVDLGDHNPAPLLLAFLRSPTVIRDADRLADWFLGVVDGIRNRRKPRKDRFVPNWLAPEIAGQLHEFGLSVGLGLFANPFSSTSEFWNSDDRLRFAAALVVMAARRLVCCRKTDNVTWLRPGGFSRKKDITSVLRTTLKEWLCFAEESQGALKEHGLGSLNLHLLDLQVTLPPIPKPDWIVTSPPYANRLDYTRLWAPEMSVLAAVCNTTAPAITERMIGTNVVHGIDFSPEEERRLPKEIRTALAQIQQDPAKYSANYYYPFFRNYAVSLACAMRHLADVVATHTSVLVFVRDTVRKDILFPTANLVKRILTSKQCGLKCIGAEKTIIRHHIGFLRKASSRGVFGLAQVEWWLSFQRPNNGKESNKNGRAP